MTDIIEILATDSPASSRPDINTNFSNIKSDLDTAETKLATIEENADVTDAGNVASSIHGATTKGTPIDADEVGFLNSVGGAWSLVKATWTEIKAFLKTYFDTLYVPITSKVFINVKDYGATGDGTTDDTAAIQSALDVLEATDDGQGGVLFLPTGTYVCSGNLDIYKQTIMQGEGKRVTVLKFTHTGDGINSTWAINSSTAVFIGLRDLSIHNANVSNTGGGFVDVGGTYVDLFNVDINGFYRGIIFDQTEIATIKQCNITNQLHSGIWLVYNDEHTTGASSGFTNRIVISGCQFNTNAGIGIIDDGGACHTIRENNFQGGTIAIWIAKVPSINIRDNEFEGQTSETIYIKNYTQIGANVGGANVININGNAFYPNANTDPSIVNATSIDALDMHGNYFGASTAACVTGAASIVHIDVGGNEKNGGGKFLDTEA